MTFKELNFDYTLKISRRAKRLRLAVNRLGEVTLTRPAMISPLIAEKFLHSQAAWVLSKISEQASRPHDPLDRLTRRDYLFNREAARQLVLARLEVFNQIYKFKYQRVSIRDQKTRWGSCSRQGNLNFSYKLIYLEPELQDYIIVHELCHLEELNHSVRFWRLVAKAVPDFSRRRARLRRGLVQ